MLKKKPRFFMTDATPLDFKEIHLSLMKPNKAKFIGPSKRKAIDVDSFFHHYCTHRIMIKETEASPVVIGYAEIHNFPPIGAVPISSWMDWLKYHYCLQLPVSTSNILFLNYFAYVNSYSPYILLRLLSEVFFRENEVRYIIMVEMPDRPPRRYCSSPDEVTYDILYQYSQVYYPIVYNIKTCSNVQKLHVFVRDRIVAKMRYRLALPEDNDDIVEIIDKDRPDLRAKLGDFYIAEKLLNEDETNNKLIVTEVNNQTVGFIWLNEDVDILKIITNYDCQMYSSLTKFTQFEPFRDKIIWVQACRRRPLNMMFTDEAIDEALRKESRGSRRYTPRMSMLNMDLTKFKTGENERISVIENYFGPMQEITRRLTSLHYYYDVRDKALRLYYNTSMRRSTVNEDAANKAINKSANMFAMQLFGLIGTKDIRRMYRFIASSFTAYPDRDYCVVSIPVGEELSPPLYELLKYFTHLQPRPGCMVKDRVFITHRSTIYGDISVHEARDEDVEPMENMLKTHAKNRATVAQTGSSFMQAPEDTNDAIDLLRHVLVEVLEEPYSDYRVYTLRCGNAANSVDENVMVGFVVIRPFTKLHELHPRFSVMPRTFHTPKEIVMLRLHPFYHFKSDTIFRELARKTHCYSFYYVSPTRCCFQPLPNDLTNNMQPMEPRRTVKLNLNPTCALTISPSAILDRIDFKRNSYEVFAHNLRVSRFFGNQKHVVIIGFNNVCKVYLRKMLFCWNQPELGNLNSYCCLPKLDVTVIVEPGVIEAEYDGFFSCSSCVHQEDCWVNQSNYNDYITDCIRRMDFRKFVTFVSGYVAKIDREKKLVILTNNCEIHYENLLLLNATKFGPPRAIVGFQAMPSNFATFNHRLDRIIFYYKLNMLRQESTIPHIIIYGANFSTFEFINFLIAHNLPGSTITLVTPLDPEARFHQATLNNSEGDPRIEEILADMCSDLGVKLVENYNFVSWTPTHDNRGLLYVEFTSIHNDQVKLQLYCDLFVSFRDRHIDLRTHEVLKEAGIAMDALGKKIYVNAKFQTNDPNIYATGHFITYRVKPNHQYKYVGVEETAEKLLQVLRPVNCGYLGEFEEKFKKTAYFHAVLPMGYHLAKVTVPKRYLANHLTNDYNPTMTTYKDETFARVRLNQNQIVEQILVVTKKKMSLDFLQYFCGKHETMLNNLVGNWRLGELDDFLAFFMEPWSQLLMHDAYDELHNAIAATVTPEIEQYLNLEIDRRERKIQFRRHAHNVGLQMMVEDRFLSFLRKYRYEFSQPIALPEDFVQNK